MSCTMGADVNNRRDNTALCGSNVGFEPVRAITDLPIKQYIDILMHNLCHRAYKLPERTDNHIRDKAVSTEK